MHDLLASHASILAVSLLTIFGGVWPYVIMLLGFSLIVFVHELGHFAVAKWAGVRVDRFAVGFGRELFGFTKGETRYSFNILPLGGYVKMLGQEDFDDKAKELQFNDNPDSFVNKPVSHRMAIVSAGVIMNTLFACFLFMIVFLYGREAIGTRIAYVEPDSPAERSGLVPGDVIKKINGEKILEFNEVYMSVMLAQPHEPIDFEVERDGQRKVIPIKPEYLIPENTREAQRLIVGIAPGVTREIVSLGPEIDPTKPDQPHVGDVIVEINGVPITDDNANEAVHVLAYAEGDVFVERKDPKHPTDPPQRVRVEIPPILTLYPDNDTTGSVSVLGLEPLVRVSSVEPRGRAHLAGLEVGDTIVNWDDKPFPTKTDIARAIQDSPERDIYFQVRKQNGRVVEGFLHPKANRRGPATVQAIVEQADQPAEGGAPARFSDVRPTGRAAQAGIETGDVILSCQGLDNPSMRQVNEFVRTSPDRPVAFIVRKSTGRMLSAWVTPQAPGGRDAKFDLVADDVLRISNVVETIHGQTTPAARAGLRAGALITAVDGQPVTRWRQLIDAFRAGAGRSVELAFLDAAGASHTAAFPVPNSLRTLLGVGAEARIISIDGRRTILMDTPRGREEASVGYRKATRQLLAELIDGGKAEATVEFRRNPLSPIESKTVAISRDMIDPWLGRIAFQPSINVMPEMTVLKGEGPLDAVSIGLHKTYYFILQVYKTMERMIFSRTVGVENISGPLGIIDVGGKVARSGLIGFLFFMAIISANLAVINFLPLPIMDGGLMVFLIIEKIKGSPVSLRVQVATQMIGLFLIIGVFVLVTFQDAMRLWG